MRTMVKYALLFFFITLIGPFSLAAHARADISLSTIKQIPLGSQPLDVAASPDGRKIYILLEKEIAVYSLREGRITNHLPLSQRFDRLTFSPRINALILSSSSEKTVSVVEIEDIFKINISGAPFHGPENAPVTVVVFGDYQ
ncbi:MAG: hypothetical protein DRH11_10270 [Deltaproteobacteria bacterium]|nr:hypothetical protein [Deltaproteobacteria bacterium]MBW1935738.1 hypothetical protein [Deltaproteobacteria bacterium]RLB32945.1 MAG: hypothetical protein DRH11_10270 [Deltaproteobacteria bacterium]